MSIGEILREARAKKGMSLEEVENETKIRRKYLRAMENDDFSTLPGKVYVRGFLRTYARFLGLDGEELVRQYDEMFPYRPEAEQAVGRTAVHAKVADRRRRGVVYFALVLIVGIVIYLWGAATPQEKPGEGEPEHAVPGEQEYNYGGSGRPRSRPAGEPGAGGDREPQLDGIQLVLQVRDRECWMQVVVDGENNFQGLVQPGVTKRFTGRGKIWFKLGDAGAVRVLVNNRDYGVLGEPGQVVTREFTAGEGGVKTDGQ